MPVAPYASSIVVCRCSRRASDGADVEEGAALFK